MPVLSDTKPERTHKSTDKGVASLLQKKFDGSTTRAEKTFLHLLDVRTKMLISVLAAVVVIILSEIWLLASLATLTLGYVLISKRYAPVAIAYCLFAILWLLAFGFMHGMSLALPRFGYPDMQSLIAPFLRSLVLLNTLLAMALSSRIQGVMSSLKALRLPYWLYIPAAAMVRFIPAFIEDIRQIVESLEIKGYRRSPFFLLRHPLIGLRLLFIPLLFRALRTSDELGMAAELKGIGYSRKVSRLNSDRMGWRDFVLLTFAVLITSAALSLEFEILVQFNQ
ncbi:energy-coupling factor transporter transmembrane protein EcfT [Halorhodospira halochloris]|uniref:energy-coupling factor transporter transmembrane component T family protein n=1 Tax=Halorhodospira halochloris TaxID=1052 RepID=UPI001EE82243|nr:energy-coupling factor transporter transmembrane component T [Halorhodospira halochloris]MCG5529888.1 energy-coupling factor transporter transmembrane protein EcfT [Halorhodospira halochloris]MCG5549414.1 energy-coupling factor transporter transmembrane protein EcfT [Halorhodospira halochloris]